MTDSRPRFSKPVAFFRLLRLNRTIMVAIITGAGAFGRPHIANYLIARGIVNDRQETFDKYLVKCDVPKYPLSLAEASELVRDAGGSDCHQNPVTLGSVDVPDFVAGEFISV